MKRFVMQIWSKSRSGRGYRFCRQLDVEKILRGGWEECSDSTGRKDCHPFPSGLAGQTHLLRELVKEIRKINGDVPVGVNWGLAHLLGRIWTWWSRQVWNFITVDGMNAATSGDCRS